MRGNRWHSPLIPWYPDVMRPGHQGPTGWYVCSAGSRLPSSDRLEYDSGVRVWDSECLGAFRWLRELTAREPLMRMARTGIDSDVSDHAPRGLTAQDVLVNRRPLSSGC